MCFDSVVGVKGESTRINVHGQNCVHQLCLGQLNPQIDICPPPSCAVKDDCTEYCQSAVDAICRSGTCCCMS